MRQALLAVWATQNTWSSGNDFSVAAPAPNWPGAAEHGGGPAATRGGGAGAPAGDDLEGVAGGLGPAAASHVAVDLDRDAVACAGWRRRRSLSTADAVQLINRQKAVVVDVCGPEEYAEGHVSGAKNVPLLQERLPTVVKNKSVPIIMVCSRGARERAARPSWPTNRLPRRLPAAWVRGVKNLPVEKG